MNVAIFTLGLSPPIATEFLLKLRERAIRVERAIAVMTQGSLPSFHILKLALHWSRTPPPDLRNKLWVEDLGEVDLKPQTLDIGDITNVQDCRSFRTQFSSALRDGLRWAQGDPSKVHVCIAGGRKTMPVDAILTCIASGVTQAYHLIAPKIPGIADEFAKRVERDEEFVEDLKKLAANPADVPEHQARYALEVCFPPKDLEIHLVRYPLPKLLEQERKAFAEGLF